MKKLIPTLLLALTLTFSNLQAQGNQGKRIATRIAQALGFKTDSPRVMLLTTALACTTLLSSCSGVKPSLYKIGVLNPSSAMQAKTIADAVLAAQPNLDKQPTSELQIMLQHAYLHKPTGSGYKAMLVKIVREKDSVITVQGYADQYELTTDREAIAGYLFDNHPNVGRIVKLTSDAVGISHLNGMVFAVYTNGIHAIKITSKTTLEGEQEELHTKDDAPHIRFAYESQLY